MLQKTAQQRVNQRISADTLARQIIPSIILAPSAHNTQPWKFKVSSNTIDIFVDWSRHLSVSDPTLRQLYVGLGCATTNAISAAHYWNTTAKVQYFPAGFGKDMPVVRLTFTPAGNSTDHNQNEADIFAAITQRHTNRSYYDGQPLTQQEKSVLNQNLDHNIVSFISESDKLEQLAEVSQEGTFSTLSRKDFKEELSHWVRNSWTYQHDGMPGYAMGIPAPLSLVAPLMVRVAPIHIQEAAKTKQQVTTASTLAVFSTTTDTPIDHLNTGQQLQQTWLNATVAGLAAMPVVAAIEAGPKYRQKVRDLIQAKPYPQSILRIGHSSKTNLRSTPRRTLEECLN